MSDEPIARYQAELDRRLRGRPNRRRLVEEAADHLRESQAALRATGMGDDEAAREAVRRLGPPGEIAAAGGGRTAAAVVLVLGVLGAVALVVAAAAKNPPFRDAPQPALPLYLFFGGLGVGVIAMCAAWTVWAWSDPRATRGVVVTSSSAIRRGPATSRPPSSARSSASSWPRPVLGLTLYAMSRHARRERRTLGLDVAAR